MAAGTRKLARSDPGQSFFTLIQSHLRDKYSGRLMALVLCELGRQEPEAFLRFLKLATPAVKLGDVEGAIKRGDAQFDREWCFRDGRYADVAVFVSGEPAIIIEVKEDDVNAPRNPEQLLDYCDWASTNPEAIFIHLSRYSPMKALPTLKAAAGKVHDVWYRHLYQAVRSYEEIKTGQAPLSAMVREYLEDSGANAYKSLNLEKDQTALTFLLVQIAGFDHFHGLGRLQSTSSVTQGPALLATLLGNASVLGEWLHEPNWKLITQRPQARFYTEPFYKPKLLAEAAMEAEPGELVEVPPKALQTGQLRILARGSLKRDQSEPGRWAYVDIGYYVNVSAAEKEKARIALYASVYWKGGHAYSESDQWLTDFPSEHEATVELQQHLKCCMEELLSDAGHPQVFRNFKFPEVRT